MASGPSSTRASSRWCRAMPTTSAPPHVSSRSCSSSVRIHDRRLVPCTGVTERRDDRSDVELLARPDPAAFAELYRRHVESVHAWFQRRLAWAAADLTAETFARAWLSRRRFRDRRGGSALPWLHGIASNVLRESARRDRIETCA